MKIYYTWMDSQTWVESPLGKMLLTSDGRSLMGLYWEGQTHFPQITEEWQRAPELALFAQVQQQLIEYFQYEREEFNIPLNLHGTAFQKQVWQLLSLIPFGETKSYGDLAKQLGKASASRAVGAANGRNPISIIVPCHRVIAGNGKLTGYAGGLDRKQWLLHHEQVMRTSCPTEDAAIQGNEDLPIQQSLMLF